MIYAFMSLGNAEIRQVQVLSRHGVRGPYGPRGLDPTEANLQMYTQNGYDFPVSGKAWGTAENEQDLVIPKITKHGEKVIQEMGKVCEITYIHACI